MKRSDLALSSVIEGRPLLEALLLPISSLLPSARSAILR